jgi:hypothetical protein
MCLEHDGDPRSDSSRDLETGRSLTPETSSGSQPLFVIIAVAAAVTLAQAYYFPARPWLDLRLRSWPRDNSSALCSRPINMR